MNDRLQSKVEVDVAPIALSALMMAYEIPVSREYMIDLGLIEPDRLTPEEERWHRRYELRRRLVLAFAKPFGWLSGGTEWLEYAALNFWAKVFRFPGRFEPDRRGNDDDD